MPAAATASPTFTVFTPTFNRAHSLHRVHASLAAQTLRDFEWLVVDDGSTDGTRALVEAWRAQATFPIRYYWQTNAGKHVAHNLAAALAQGRFFLVLDSDDGCTPDALQRLLAHWEEIPGEQRAHFAGVTARCVDQHGAPVGADFAGAPFDATLLEMIYRRRMRVETWGFLRTDLVRAHPFPVPAHFTTHVPEAVVWGAIARTHLTRYVNDRLRIYTVAEGSDSLSGTGVMTQRRLQRMAPGLALWHQATLTRDLDYFTAAPALFLRSAIHFVRFSLHDGVGILAQMRALRWRALPLYLAGLLPGLCLFAKDRLTLPKDAHGKNTRQQP